MNARKVVELGTPGLTSSPGASRVELILKLIDCIKPDSYQQIM